MTPRLRTLLILLCLLPASAQACVLGNSDLRVGYFHFPPLYFQNETGEAAGDAITLLDQVMARIGCHHRYKLFGSAPRLMEQVTAGHIDLAMGVRHPLMERLAIYGTQPILNLHLDLYWLERPPSATNLAALRGSRLIVLRGYGYGGLIGALMEPANGIDVTVAEGHQHAFARLLRGEADYVLDYRGPSRTTLQTMAPNSVQSLPWSEKAVYFVLSRRVAHPEALLATLESAAQAVLPQP